MKIKPTHEVSFDDLVDKYGGNVDVLAGEFLNRHLSATEQEITAAKGGTCWLQSLARASFDAIMNRMNGQDGILRAIHPKRAA